MDVGPPFDSFNITILLCDQQSRKSHAQSGPGAIQRNLKSVYHDEPYQCLYRVLKGPFAQSKWSGPGSRRRIDFRIPVAEGEGWGIECLREGDHLDSHVKRFISEGDYDPYIGDGYLTDYALVGFRGIESSGAMPDFAGGPRYSTSD